MKLTALDIRQKTFEKSFRGVDKDEVQAFLTTVSQQWERLGDENRELRLKLEHAQQDVQKMREVESSSTAPSKRPRTPATAITEQAQRGADLRRREAQLQAEQALAEARQRARAIVEEAYQTAEKTVADMQREASGLGQECQRLEQQLDSLVRDLHHLASDALEKVERARAASQRRRRRPSFRGRRAYRSSGPPRPAAAEPSASPTPPPCSYHPLLPAHGRRRAAYPRCFVRCPAPGQRLPRLLGPAPPATTPSPASSQTPARPPSPDIERPQRPAREPRHRAAAAHRPAGPSKLCPRRPRPTWSPPGPRLLPIGPDRPDIQQLPAHDPPRHGGSGGASRGEVIF
ncbi:MAG: DivIVA domain-containing protein [Hymenobacter sp.]